MKCPKNIHTALAEILRQALLNTRVAAQSGDTARCHAEADHVHNLPSLLTDFAPDVLRFYWNVERASYIREAGVSGSESFSNAWSRLEVAMREQGISTTKEDMGQGGTR